MSNASPVVVPSIVVSLAGLLALPAMAAEIAPVSQTRSAFADSFVVLGPVAEQDLVDVAAPDLAPFSTAFTTTASLANGTASFDLAHASEFRPFGFLADGFTLSTSSIVGAGGFCYSVGSSSATISFLVPSGTPYRLGAALAGGPNGQTKLSLTGPGGAIISKSLTGLDESVHASGTLAGGLWTLHVSTFSSTTLSTAGTMTDDGSFTLYLSTSPSAADLDLDGVVNAVDLGLLLGAWGPCDGCIADVDGSGVVDAADLAALLGDWS